jgi:hypothetical protein
VFVEGKECSTFQPLAVRNNALASLKEIASLTHEQMNGIYTDYMTATGALLLKAREYPLPFCTITGPISVSVHAF